MVSNELFWDKSGTQLISIRRLHRFAQIFCKDCKKENPAYPVLPVQKELCFQVLS